jgi:hypothetical protein
LNIFLLDNLPLKEIGMKLFLTKILMVLGIVSFFKGTFGEFKTYASESSSSSTADRSETMGGRTGGCGKCD